MSGPHRLRHTLAMARSSPLIICEMTLAARARTATPPFSTLSMELSAEQHKAQLRLADYPRRVERLKRLWMDTQIDSAHVPGEPGESSYQRPRIGRSRSSTRLVRAGAATLNTRLSGHRGQGLSHHGRRACSTTRDLKAQGPLTAAQIRELMSREITPEDYELLLLLDEGIKKARTLSSGAAASLPQATGDKWIGEECRICLCALEGGEDVRVLPGCGHMYHAPCVERWLQSSKATCPLCGAEVQETS